jgi:hypothetical protein
MIATPALKRFKEAQRESGRTNICLSNVQQISRGMAMYAQDYDDHLPVATNWMDGIAPYAESAGAKDGGVMQCPTIVVSNPKAFGYAYNSKLSGRSFTKLTGAAMTPIVYDSSNLSRNASDPQTSMPNPPRHRARRMRAGGGRLNIMGYADGHAKAINSQGKAAQVPGLDTTGQ